MHQLEDTVFAFAAELERVRGLETLERDGQEDDETVALLRAVAAYREACAELRDVPLRR